MRPEIQNMLGNNGGVPVAGDPSQITDPKHKRADRRTSTTLTEQDGLAFYPDWPVPGYYDVLVVRPPGARSTSRSRPSEVLDAARRALPGRRQGDRRLTSVAARRSPRPRRARPGQARPRPRPDTGRTTMATDRARRTELRRAAPASRDPRRRRDRPTGSTSSPAPSLFIAVIVVPLVVQHLPVAHRLVGHRHPASSSGSTTTPQLFADERLLDLVPQLARDDRRDGRRADAASAWCSPRCSSTHRQAVRRPRRAASCGRRTTCRRSCPSPSPASCWGWILRPRRRAQRRCSRRSASARSPRTGSATPTPRCPRVMVVMVWVQIGYPVVIFMAALQRVDPELYEAAELDGAGWFQRFRAITIRISAPRSSS